MFNATLKEYNLLCTLYTFYCIKFMKIYYQWTKKPYMSLLQPWSKYSPAVKLYEYQED